MSAFNSVLKIADENLDNIYNCMAIEENKRDIFCFNNDRYYSWLEQKEREKRKIKVNLKESTNGSMMMHLVDGEVKKKNNIVLMKVSADKKNLIGHIPTQRKAPTLKIGNWKDDYRYYLCKKYFEEGIKEGVHYNFSKYEGSNIDLLNYIYDKMIDKVDDVDKDSLDAYIDKYIVRRMINTYQRIRRAYRKVDFHSSVGAYFNYFITITYDDALFNSPEEFSRKFYRCMDNLSYRRGWRCIVREERGSENERLHYHIIAHIPSGQLLGRCRLMSTANKHIVWRREYRNENDFFRKNFGINDFEEIAKDDKPATNECLDYILKYIIEDDVHLRYSRGLPEEVLVPVDMDKDVDLECGVFEGKTLTKYLLVDSVGIYMSFMDRFSYLADKKLDDSVKKYKNSLNIS